MRTVFFLGCVTVASALMSLPPYIKPCARTDPHIDECALERAKEIIPIIAKGDRKFKIPVLDPFEIKELKIIDKGPRQAVLKITAKDVKIHGLKNTEIKKMHFNFSKDEVRVNHLAVVPRIQILSKYDISGNLLVLPIRGNGDSNITLINSTMHMEAFYDLKKIDGTTHMVLRTMNMPVKPTRMYVKMTNLFGGNKLLGDEMNQFINSNWEEVFQEVHPTISDTYKSFIVPLINSLSTQVPYDEIFPETV